MPRRPTAKGFPFDPAKCRASRHMPPTTVAKVWEVLCGYAYHHRKQRGGTGQLIFTASIVPTLCNEVPCKRDAADEAIDWLLTVGWIVLVEEGVRNRQGKRSPNTYRLLEHDEFVALHPGSCPPCIYEPSSGKRFENHSPTSDAAFRQFFNTAPQFEPLRRRLDLLIEYLESLTAEERATIKEYWKSLPAPVETGQDLEPTTPVVTGPDDSGLNRTDHSGCNRSDRSGWNRTPAPVGTGGILNLSCTPSSTPYLSEAAVAAPSNPNPEAIVESKPAVAPVSRPVDPDHEVERLLAHWDDRGPIIPASRYLLSLRELVSAKGGLVYDAFVTFCDERYLKGLADPLKTFLGEFDRWAAKSGQRKHQAVVTEATIEASTRLARERLNKGDAEREEWKRKQEAELKAVQEEIEELCGTSDETSNQQ